MKLTKLAALSLAASVSFASFAYAEITIGLIAPLTGPVAAYGDQVRNGAQVAVDQINKNGGILGEQVVLKLADDAGEPKQGVSAANQLVADGIRFVVGPVTSGVAMAASDVFAENGVIMVTPTATAPDLTNRGLQNIFRTCGRDDQQAEVAANYVLANLKDKKVAIINDKGTYGKGLSDSFKATLNNGGVTEVLYESLTPGERDLSALTAKLKQANVDVLFFGGYHPEAGLLSRQLKDVGIDILMLGGEGLSNTEYWSISSGAGEGTIFTNASDATKNPDAAVAIAALNAANIPPEAFTLNAYAAVEVIKAGIEKAGTAEDSEAVAAALRSGDSFATTIGAVTYGDTGDLTSQAFSLFKWNDGKIVAVE